MSNLSGDGGTPERVADAISASDRGVSGIARITGIPYASLRRKVAGETPFRLSELFLIADATGVPTAQFVSPDPSSG